MQPISNPAGPNRTLFLITASRADMQLRTLLLTSCVIQATALQLHAPLLQHSRPLRSVRQPIRMQEEETAVAKVDEPPSFTDGFLAAAGLFANPLVFFSEYNTAATGIGLESGQYNLLGAVEGVSYLVVAWVILAALYSKVTKGSGLPAGPLGLLGLTEGLSFLSLLGAILVFPGRELGVVGDPATAMINVPEVTAQVAAVVGPLVAQGTALVSEQVSNIDTSSIKLPEGLPDVSALSEQISKIDVSALKLPEGLPSVDLSSLKLPEGVSLPDISSLKLPEGVSLPSLPEGLSLPDVKLPEGMPGMPLDSAPPVDAPAAAPVE